jgi:hypothetical protein
MLGIAGSFFRPDSRISYERSDDKVGKQILADNGVSAECFEKASTFIVNEVDRRARILGVCAEGLVYLDQYAQTQVVVSWEQLKSLPTNVITFENRKWQERLKVWRGPGFRM